VATVVAKLLALFRPEVAIFGEKDWQQLQVISRLNADLGLGAQVVGMPIIREADGLAMSSRNSYLAGDERRRALAISRGLLAAQALAQRGVAEVARLLAAVRGELAAAEIREDYVEVVHPTLLQPLDRLEPGAPARALVAGFVGATRLIDNLALELK
jgi:pantoate--beta-alanine ligase